MSLDSIIAQAARRRADHFRGEGRVERPSGTSTFDPVTGINTPDPPTTLYEGPWTLRIQKWQGTNVIVGDEQLRLHEAMLQLPTDTEVQKDDQVIATASTYDSSLPGRSFRVTDVFRDDQQAGRRLLVQEVE